MPKAKPKPPALSPGEQIRMARLARRMSQSDLAARLGLKSQGQLSSLELGRVTPTIDWFLSHIDVWRDLGLVPDLFAALLADASVDVCPLCRRPV